MWARVVQEDDSWEGGTDDGSQPRRNEVKLTYLKQNDGWTQTCRRSSHDSGSTHDYKKVRSWRPGCRIGKHVELAGLGSIKIFPIIL